MKKVLINAANIHGGGALQVAVSFIYELSKLNIDLLSYSLDIIASSEVIEELETISVDIDLLNIKKVNFYGLRAFFMSTNSIFSGYDMIFTIFGPGYFKSVKALHVVGFAQAWIIYPDNESSRTLSVFSRLTLKLKYYIQKKFFSRADHLIVELEHVKQGLALNNIKSTPNISVVHNCLSSVFFEPECWSEKRFDFPSDKLVIGIVSRDYPHKNLSLLSDVATILSRKGLDVCFAVTFTEDEWEQRTTDFKRHVINVGALKSVDCPAFYNSLDGVIFPSLLESFSITPFEALFMRKPLFASDRSFIRDSCSNFAYYFEPTRADNIAETINSYFKGHCTKYDLTEAKNYAVNFSSSKSRALEYLKVINKIIG